MLWTLCTVCFTLGGGTGSADIDNRYFAGPLFAEKGAVLYMLLTSTFFGSMKPIH